MFAKSSAALVAVLIATIVTTAGAYAACTQADAAGNWRVYAGAFDSGASWQRCVFSVNAGGVVATTSYCLDSARRKAFVKNGSVKLVSGPQCSFNGQFGLGTQTNKLTDLTLAPDKNSGGGVGTSAPGSDTFIFMFFRN
jgi:hypothetical protein